MGGPWSGRVETCCFHGVVFFFWVLPAVSRVRKTVFGKLFALCLWGFRIWDSK